MPDRRRVGLTVAQVAAMCGVSPITVRGWVVRGHVRRTARGLIDGASLVAYLDRRGATGQHRRAPDVDPGRAT